MIYPYRKRSAGFTLIELMLAVMAFLTLLTLVLLVVARQQVYRRDVMRAGIVQQVQKALAMYQSSREGYPEFLGCLTGKDQLTRDLIVGKFLEEGASFADPKWPDDLTKCIFYKSDGSDYTLRYTMESDRAQPAGEHVARP